MTSRIDGVGQIVALLRERLQRAEKDRSREAGRTAGRTATPQQRIAALASVADLPPRDFRRAVVRGLLSERLGDALVSDPAFDKVTGEVLRIIEDSDEGRALLDEVAAGFRDT